MEDNMNRRGLYTLIFEMAVLGILIGCFIYSVTLDMN